MSSSAGGKLTKAGNLYIYVPDGYNCSNSNNLGEPDNNQVWLQTVPLTFTDYYWIVAGKDKDTVSRSIKMTIEMNSGKEIEPFTLGGFSWSGVTYMYNDTICNVLMGVRDDLVYQATIIGHDIFSEEAEKVLISVAPNVDNTDMSKKKLGELYYEKASDYYDYDEELSTVFLEECLSLLTVEDNPEVCARAYNLMGIFATHKEDYASAINHNSTCLSICYKYNLSYIAALSSSNLGFLFQNIGNLESAITYYEQAATLFSEDKSDPKCEAYNATLYANIFNCLYKVKDIEKMEPVLEKMREAKDIITPRFSIALYDAIYYSMTENKDAMLKNIKDAVKQSLVEEEMSDFIDNYQILCEFLYEQSLIKELGKVLDTIDANISDAIFPRIRIDFMKYRMFFYEKTGNIEGFVDAAKQYVALYDTITDIFHKSISESVNLQIAVKKLEAEQKLFEKKAEEDALTQLLNRDGMIKKANLLINKAKEAYTEIATFIIDIDYFKQYNDHYGHVIGDDCIRKVAEVLKSTCGDSHICRFGGDEFVAVINDISREKAQKTADSIVANVLALQLESADSPVCDYVTVSVGYYVGIPTSDETLKTLVANADKGLYTAKEDGRNRACTDF